MFKFLFFIFIGGICFSGFTSRITAGDPARGKKIFESRCMACHSLSSNGVGPGLSGVVGRRAGQYPRYEYSKALKTSKVAWSEENLQRFLKDPGGFLPGQKMYFKLPGNQERDDVISFLKSN